MVFKERPKLLLPPYLRGVPLINEIAVPAWFRLRSSESTASSSAILFVVLCIVASAGTASCQSASADPPDGFSFVGDWNCDGTFADTKMPHRFTYRGEMYGDRWTQLTEVDIEPKGYVAHYQLRANVSGIGVVFIDTNPAGYSILKGLGWKAQKLTVTSEAVPQHSAVDSRYRFRYIIKDSQHFDVLRQNEKRKAWETEYSVACSKQEVSTVNYFIPDVEVGKTYNTVFSRTVSFKADGIDDIVRRVAGTGSTSVTKSDMNTIQSDDTFRYDGIQEGHGASERRDAGRISCFNGKCETATDGSGTFFNEFLWGKPPALIRPGVTWVVQFDRPWELGTTGKQSVTVLSADAATGMVLLKREGSGEGYFEGDLKELSITRAGKTYKVANHPGPSHWVGQTLFRRGLVISDELLVERSVTLSAPDLGVLPGTERQFILLNAAP